MSFDDTFIVDDIELKTDAIDRARQSLMKRQMYEVMYALYEGYDGADIIVDELTGYHIHKWNDDPPSYSPYDAPVDRYDFRDTEFSEYRRDSE